MVGALDLKVYRTLNSLGGAITATQVNSSTPNNLFSNVLNSQRVAGEDFYACVYFKNGHATEAMNNFKLWLSDKSFPHDTEIKWGFDPSATAQTIADQYTAPTGIVWQSLGGSPQTFPTPATPPVPTYHYEPYQTFNGTSDSISIPSTAALQLNQLSIAAWFRTSLNYNDPANSISNDPSGTEGMILVKGQWVGTGSNVSYGMWITDHNGLRGGFETSASVDYLAHIPGGSELGFDGGTLADPRSNDGKWHLGVVTHDGANVKLYFDGTLMDTTATGGAVPEVNTADVTIGVNDVTTDPMYFKGDLDEIRVWNNDLTAGEIASLYSDGTVPQSGNVVYTNKFGTDVNFPGDTTPGNLIAGQSFPIWIWYHVSANAVSRIDDSELFSFAFDIPQGGTAPPPPPPPTDGGGGGGSPPPVNADYKVAFVGDEGCTSTTDAVISLINTNAYNFVVSVGDHAYSSNTSCWTGRFSSLKNAGKLNSAYGNHEYDDGVNTFKTFFGHNLTYFTFKFQNIQFFVCDTNINCDPGSGQHTFITNALMQSMTDNTVTWRIGVMHHPWFGASSNHSNNEFQQVQAFHSLFITHKVSFVTTGHNHNFQRTHQVGYNSGSPTNPTIVNSTPPFSRNTAGLIHVVTGTGGHDSGSGLYSLGSQPSFQAFQNRTHNGLWEIIASNNAQTLTCSFVDKNGEKFDTFTINA